MRRVEAMIVVWGVTLVFCAGPNRLAAEMTVVDFEDLTLSDESFYNGSDGAGGFVSRGAEFNNLFTDFGGGWTGWTGWSYSNRTDTVTPGPGNQYSAVTGAGVAGSPHYGVAYNPDEGDAVITLPGPVAVVGAYVTNTSYAYHAVVEGDDGSTPAFVKGPFAAGDWFRLDVIGRDASGAETGRVPFYLADFRDGASRVVDAWEWLDLEPLGDQVASLAFALDSTDRGEFGMNTPGYFALDGLRFGVVPEPTSASLVLLALFGATACRASRHALCRRSV